MQKLSKNNKGFTLIELLIVIVIIAILTTIGLSNFRSSRMKARDAKRQSHLKQMQEALEAYNNDNGQYPNDNGSGIIVSCGSACDQACVWGNSEFCDEDGAVYMVDLPKDPYDPYTYYYDVLGSTNNQYQLYARIENTRDPKVQKNAEDIPQKYQSLSCGSENCNWGVSSSNTSPNEGRTLVDDN